MVYIKQNHENQKALSLIEDVLLGHEDLKRKKEQDFLDLYQEFSLGEIAENVSSSGERILELQEDIERIDIQISAVKYVRDYVKLMLKLAGS